MFTTTTRLFVSRTLQTTRASPIVFTQRANMSSVTSSADPNSLKNKAAQVVGTVHNAVFGVGSDKPQGGSSHLDWSASVY